MTFGTYPQTAEGNDETPIEWLVLDRNGDHALLLSRYSLDVHAFYPEHVDVTWEKSTLRAIEHAILASDLGVTPSNDGNCIRLPFPQLTEERRKELAKQCKAFAEEACVAVRNARREANSDIAKTIKEESLPEDDQKRYENEIQKMTDKYIATIDEACKKKEAEVMTV